MRRSHATAVGRPVNGGYQSVSFTGSAAATANAVGGQIRSVVLYATEDCHIRFGQGSPAATATDCFLPKDTYALFPIQGGEKVSAIQNTTAGTLHVSELDH